MDWDGGLQGVTHLTSLPDQTGKGGAQATPQIGKRSVAAPAAGSRPSGVVKRGGSSAGGSKRARLAEEEQPSEQQQRQQQEEKEKEKQPALKEGKQGRAEPITASGKQPGSKQARQRPAAAATIAPVPAPQAGVAAMAAAAGAQAAAKSKAAAAGASTAGQPSGAANNRARAASKKTGTATAAARSAPAAKRQRAGTTNNIISSPASPTIPLPEIPGVSEEAARRVAAMPRMLGRRCGECKYCRHPKVQLPCGCCLDSLLIKDARLNAGC